MISAIPPWDILGMVLKAKQCSTLKCCWVVYCGDFMGIFRVTWTFRERMSGFIVLFFFSGIFREVISSSIIYLINEKLLIFFIFLRWYTSKSLDLFVSQNFFLKNFVLEFLNCYFSEIIFRWVMSLP